MSLAAIKQFLNDSNIQFSSDDDRNIEGFLYVIEFKINNSYFEIELDIEDGDMELYGQADNFDDGLYFKRGENWFYQVPECRHNNVETFLDEVKQALSERGLLFDGYVLK